MKILGCKVPDDVYERVSSLGPKSAVLRAAVEHYLDHYTNAPVNRLTCDVEDDCDVDESQHLIWELEAVVNRFKQHIEKSKRR